jgi:hypothetical protein
MQLVARHEGNVLTVDDAIDIDIAVDRRPGGEHKAVADKGVVQCPLCV